MFKKIFIGTFCFLSGIVGSVQAWELTDSYEGVSVAVREDSLRWDLKPKAKHPVVVNRLCFDHVEMIEWGIKSRVTVCHDYAMKAHIDYAMPYNKARGNAYDVSVGAGYHFWPCDCVWRITPYAGFSIERQRFESCCSSSVLNRFTDFDASLRTHWYGPWVGCDVDYQIGCGWSAYGSFAYQFTWLKGHLHAKCGNQQFGWKDSFRQHGYGYGVDVCLGLKYALCENWLLDVGTSFRLRHLTHGHQCGHHTFWDEEEPAQSWHHLKHVEWRSAKLSAALVYNF